MNSLRFTRTHIHTHALTSTQTPLAYSDAKTVFALSLVLMVVPFFVNLVTVFVTVSTELKRKPFYVRARVHNMLGFALNRLPISVVYVCCLRCG